MIPNLGFVGGLKHHVHLTDIFKLFEFNFEDRKFLLGFVKETDFFILMFFSLFIVLDLTGMNHLPYPEPDPNATLLNSHYYALS